MGTYHIPAYRLTLVREPGVKLSERPQAFVAAFLTAQHRIVGLHTVSVGCLTRSLVHPREVYKPAILASAAAIIVAHNHPSGDPEPSADDIALTRRLVAAGELLGIKLLDHLVLGEDGSYVSLSERGVL